MGVLYIVYVTRKIGHRMWVISRTNFIWDISNGFHKKQRHRFNVFMSYANRGTRLMLLMLDMKKNYFTPKFLKDRFKDNIIYSLVYNLRFYQKRFDN